MGLNDLTLEKLIGEINGYKEKMRSIYEDYGRASQELQDRINVLGYNLNEHLKDTKDQIASTPQRLLTLETKYVSGEVNEGEYRNQREEFKHLLERNLQSIEEIKSMITVLSHIEARPLNAAEFKRTAVPSIPKTPTGEEWGKGLFVQDKPNPPSLTPTATPLSNLAAPTTGWGFSPDALAPIASENATTNSSPQLQTPSSNWVPTSLQAPSTPEPAPLPLTAESPPNETALASEIAAIPATPASQGIPSGLSASIPSLDASSVAPLAADAAVPTVEIVEGGTADDALMVKVVDDIPTIDASATVVSSDDSQLQTSIPGTETPAGLTTAAPDVAQVSLTTPTQFYGVVCPKCGADVPKPAKVWELKGGKSKKNVLIGLFQCQDCRVKFREALTREII